MTNKLKRPPNRQLQYKETTPQVVTNVVWDKPKNRKEIDEWHDKHLEEHIKSITQPRFSENTQKSNPSKHKG